MKQGDTKSINELLVALERALRSQNQWQTDPPSSLALASKLPFCYDTLEFNQWLQWIFLPRLKLLIKTDADLPRESAIYEYAEEIYKNAEYDAEELLKIIKLFDLAIYSLNRTD